MATSQDPSLCKPALHMARKMDRAGPLYQSTSR
eukprot:CAMPEP_0169077450 /NCGR_PEP_ID=MMETSP1015-20121227/8887_1 /TAXON_ID=342587 /ORGANISM="Karlodinium micrum, Strain CCMP2283" /LENGTH=32 /DNA_ID= /DNA_START= /DNA_END= /DNA_ORIENTATION=